MTPRRPGSRWLLAAFLALWSMLPSTSTAQEQHAPTPLSEDDALLAEAARFMEGYAIDLRDGDRTRLADRYDRTGVHELHPGEKHFTSHDRIASRYANDWSRPGFFEWRDLSYEALGPDLVLVTGLFAWGTTASATPDVLSYGAVLRRQDGELRIRMEAEAWRPRPPWGLLAGAAALLVSLTLLASWLIRKLLSGRRLRRSARGP